MADVIEIDADVYENETLTASVDMDFAYHSGVEDVRVNNSSVVIAGVANINDFSGGSPTSANNKNGLVPKPPTLQETGQWHILSDIGWKEAYPQQDNTIPWARKNTADVGASDVKAYGYDEDADPSWGWHSVVDNLGVAKLPYGNEEHYGGVMLHHDESGVTDTEWLELNWVDVDNSGMEDCIPLLDGTTHLLDAGYLPEASTTKKGAMSAADKTKLNGIASGAEANVQSDWSQTNTSADDFIKNKPTVPTVPIYFGVCETEATERHKVVTVSGDYALEDSAILFVHFKHAVNSGVPYLNVNSTGDCPVTTSKGNSFRTYFDSSAYQIQPNSVVGFIIDKRIVSGNTAYDYVVLGYGAPPWYVSKRDIDKLRAISPQTFYTAEIVAGDTYTEFYFEDNYDDIISVTTAYHNEANGTKTGVLCSWSYDYDTSTLTVSVDPSQSPTGDDSILVVVTTAPTA